MIKKERKLIIYVFIIGLVIGFTMAYFIFAYPSKPEIKFWDTGFNYYGQKTVEIDTELFGKDFKSSYVIGDELRICFIIKDLLKKNFDLYEFDKADMILSGRGGYCGQILAHKTYLNNMFEVKEKNKNKIKYCLREGYGIQFSQQGPLGVYFLVHFKSKDEGFINWFDKQDAYAQKMLDWNSKDQTWIYYPEIDSIIWVETVEEYTKKAEGWLDRIWGLL